MKRSFMLPFCLSAAALTSALLSTGCGTQPGAGSTNTQPTEQAQALSAVDKDSASQNVTSSADSSQTSQGQTAEADPYTAPILTYTPVQSAQEAKTMRVPIKITRNGEIWASVTYDSAGRVAQIMGVMNAYDDSEFKVERLFSYEGNKLTSYQETRAFFDGDTATDNFVCTYDNQGNLIKNASELNGAFSREFAYNDKGWLTSFTALNLPFKVTYDDKSRPVSYKATNAPAEFPLTGVYENTYSDEGKLLTQIYNMGTQEPYPIKIAYTQADSDREVSSDLFLTHSFKKFDRGPFTSQATLEKNKVVSGTIQDENGKASYAVTYDSFGNVIVVHVEPSDSSQVKHVWEVTYEEVKVAPMHGALLRAINLVPTFSGATPFMVLINDPSSPIPHGVDPRYDFRADATIF